MSNEQSIGLKTLQDVRLVLPLIYSEASARTLDAALRKTEGLTGRKLSQMPADENAWYLLSRSIVWAGEFRGATPGDQQAAFETWVKKIAAMIRRAQNHVVQPAVPADERQAWNRIVAYAARVENMRDEHGELILPNMFSLSMMNLRAQCASVHPSRLTTGTAAKLLAARRADKAESFRNAISAFNRLIREQNRHAAIAHLLPTVQIGPMPLLRDAALDWSRFSDSFIASRDRAIATAVRPDREQRRDRFQGRLGASKLGTSREPKRAETEGLQSRGRAQGVSQRAELADPACLPRAGEGLYARTAG